MWNAIGIIGLLGVIGTLIAAVIFAFQHKPLWKKTLAGTGIAFILFIVGVSQAPPSAPTEPKQSSVPTANIPAAEEASSKPVSNPAPAAAKEVASTTKEEEKVIPGNLGFTPQEFRTIWNTAADGFDCSHLKISSITVSSGAVQNTFQYNFGEDIGVIGSVNKTDDSVRDIMVLGMPKDLSSSADLMLCWGILITVTNPDLSQNERNQVLRELGIYDKDLDFTKIDKSVVKGKVKYSLQGSDMIGILFTASDSKDN